MQVVEQVTLAWKINVNLSIYFFFNNVVSPDIYTSALTSTPCQSESCAFTPSYMYSADMQICFAFSQIMCGFKPLAGKERLETKVKMLPWLQSWRCQMFI